MVKKIAIDATRNYVGTIRRTVPALQHQEKIAVDIEKVHHSHRD